MTKAQLLSIVTDRLTSSEDGRHALDMGPDAVDTVIAATMHVLGYWLDPNGQVREPIRQADPNRQTKTYSPHHRGRRRK